MSSITYKNYLGLAIPFTISTVTTPLLGAVDTAVVGRLDSPTFIGGVAIGTVIFNTLYWLFGFLRVSTSGFSSQSLGSDKESDMYFAYLRPVTIATFIGLVFVLIQWPIITGAMHLYNPDPEVAQHARTYFSILIWGAPLVLVSYVNLGWLMGRKLVRQSLFLQVSTNVLNIVLDILFVMVFKLDVAGVAWATLIAQTYGLALGCVLISRNIELGTVKKHLHGIFETEAMKKMIGVNSDLLIRTACLLTMTNMFVAKGSSLGASFLAANAVLFQLQYIIAYFFDGLANAGSVFVGKAVGEKNVGAFHRTVTISNVHIALLSVLIALLLLTFQRPILGCFTDIEAVITLCKEYMIWLVVFPFVMGAGLVYYGFFTGATYTKPVRNSLLLALPVFVITYYLAIPVWHNHGLWLAFTLFSLCRSGVLLTTKNKLVADIFPPLGAPEAKPQRG
jgi:MATE family multidrug resistance protein